MKRLTSRNIPVTWCDEECCANYTLKAKEFPEVRSSGTRVGTRHICWDCLHWANADPKHYLRQVSLIRDRHEAAVPRIASAEGPDTLLQAEMDRRDLLALVDALSGTLARVRAARRNHPECTQHPGDEPVSCGWKHVVLDIDEALSEEEVRLCQWRCIHTGASCLLPDGHENHVWND